jgi:hypothetical protein
VSLPGVNGVLRTITKSLTFDTRPPTAEPFPDGNESTSSDTFDFLRGEHEVSPISSPSPEEDLWPDYLHSVAPTQSFEPAPVNFEDWIDPHLLQLRPSPVEPDATRTVIKTGRDPRSRTDRTYLKKNEDGCHWRRIKLGRSEYEHLLHIS